MLWSEIVDKGHNIRWIFHALRNGSDVWVTNDSYSHTMAPSVTIAWCFFLYQQKKLHGYFYQFSPNTGSYRAELLGLLAIHSIMSVIENYFHFPTTYSKTCCDNQGALFKSKDDHQRISTGASQTDIKQVLINVKTKLKVTFTYASRLPQALDPTPYQVTAQLYPRLIGQLSSADQPPLPQSTGMETSVTL